MGDITLVVATPFTPGLAMRVLNWVQREVGATNTSRVELDNDVAMLIPAIEAWWKPQG